MHFCILGCGKIAGKHAKILRRLENFVPGKPARFSFASRSLPRAQSFKERFQGDLAFGNYADAMAHKDIDVIVICTPNQTHLELALQALENGKDLVIEKPLACSKREADQILARARELRRMVYVAENHRYRPHIRRLEKILLSGELGAIKMIRMNVMRHRPFHEEEWRADPAAMGGGPFIDGGIHWVNVLLTLGGGDADEICALEPPVTLPNCPREDSIAILCRLKNGAIGVLTYSWAISGSFPLKFLSVHGTRGSIYISNSGLFGLQSRKFPLPVFFPWRDWQGYEAMWQDFLIHLANRSEEFSLCAGVIGRRDLDFVERAYACTQSTHAPSKPRRARQ